MQGSRPSERRSDLSGHPEGLAILLVALTSRAGRTDEVGLEVFFAFIVFDLGVSSESTLPFLFFILCSSGTCKHARDSS